MTYILISKQTIDNFKGYKQCNIKNPTGYYFYDKRTVNSTKLKDTYHYYSLKFHTTDINKVDPSKILVISSETEFDKLTILFGIKDLVCPCDDSLIYLNWPLLSRYFGGIIINPEVKRNYIQNRHTLFHYRKNGFDIGKHVYTWFDNFNYYDGCFWNHKVVDNYYLHDIQPLTNQTRSSSTCSSKSPKKVLLDAKTCGKLKTTQCSNQ